MPQTSILLADQDPQSRQTFGSFFEQHGWRYEVAGDAPTLLGALNGADYDIVIADASMTDPQGDPLLARILSAKPGQAIIAVSQATSFDQALQYFRWGATDLLAKPIDFLWLERVIRQLTTDIRENEKERSVYKHVTSERTELRFTSKELAEMETFRLPIIDRLVLARMMERGAALRLTLAVQEAIINGLEHGNLELRSEWKEELLPGGVDRFSQVRKERLQDAEYGGRLITICSWFDGRQIEVVVRDQGEGFLNNRDVNGPRVKGGVACSGRGLALMSGAADEVKFGHNGSEVTLVKRVTGEVR